VFVLQVGLCLCYRYVCVTCGFVFVLQIGLCCVTDRFVFVLQVGLCLCYR
jgi:hypothetical protein